MTIENLQNGGGGRKKFETLTTPALLINAITWGRGVGMVEALFGYKKEEKGALIGHDIHVLVREKARNRERKKLRKHSPQP